MIKVTLTSGKGDQLTRLKAVQSMMGNGKGICEMDMANKSGLMELDMKVDYHSFMFKRECLFYAFLL